MKKIIKVVQDEENIVPFEVMEESIVRISESLKKLSKTRVTNKLIVALIQDDCKLGKGIIETVILSMEQLEKNYLKAKK